MSEAVRLVGAFGTAFVLTALATPLARSLALRTGFLDHPVGFKGHRAATPYLGGVAVICGWLVAAVSFGGAFSDFAWLTAEICGIAERHARGRVVSLLEGGYDLEALATSAAAHVRALMRS